MQILIIDDDAAFRAMVLAIFADAGHDVLSAPTATEGVAYAKTLRPDIVLLDLSMPDGSGLDVLPQLVAIDGWQGIPILMLTADENIENLVLAGQRGARGYICKPVKPETLVAMVNDVLSGPDITWIDDYSKVRRVAT